MVKAWPRIRLLALIGAGSMLVHELRFVAGYGSNYRDALAEQGHSYMTSLEAVVFVLVVLAAVRFAIALVTAGRGVVTETPVPSFRRLWASASVSLALIYTVQEGLEGAFALGHPSGIVGIYGHSGWTALFFSLVVGAFIALITRLAHEALELVAARARPPRRRRAAARFARVVGATLPGGRLTVLAWNLAGRAPPRPS